MAGSSTLTAPGYTAANLPPGATGPVNAAPAASTPVGPTPAKTTQPTVLSSTNVDTKNQQNTAALANYPKAGPQVASDNITRNADQSFAAAPTGATMSDNGTWASDGKNYALGPSNGLISNDPTTQTLYDQFTTLKGQMDATAAANIENIKNTFQSYITQQEQANKSAEAGTYSLLARGGSLQTDSSSGIMQSQVSYGLQQVADLNTKEQSAVIAAQQAQQNGDFKVLDEQLSIAQQANKDKQAAAAKLSDSIIAAKQKLIDQQQQASKDGAIGAVMETGVTDPQAILKSLQDQGITNISADDISKTLANLNPDQKAVNDILKSAAQYGASADVLKKIGQSRSLTDAITAGAGYITDPSSDYGQYLTYSRQAQAAGHTPEDYTTWSNANDVSQTYKKAYAEQSAKNAFAGSDSNQQKLEQQGRQVVLKTLSNRSGGLGLQDAKVNQAIHLKALVDQYKQTKNVQNVSPEGYSISGTHQQTVYNIPTAQYAELAIGLANLISPTGTTAESDRQNILARTAAGDLNGALQFITGTPHNGNTQAMIQNSVDTIDRQGATAEQERQTYLDNMASLLPSDLTDDRRENLMSALKLNSYVNPKANPIIENETTAKSTVQSYITANPDKTDEVKTRIQGLEEAAGRPITTVEFLQAYPEYSQ